MTRPASILELIAAAQSEQEIAQALARGRTFQFANPRTRQRWESKAKGRRAQLREQNGARK